MRDTRTNTTRTTSLWFASALLSLALFTGCGELGGLFGVQSPDASYRSFAVQSLNLETIGFDLGFDLANPNSFDLPVAQLDWSLDLFDESFSFGQILFEEPNSNTTYSASNGGVLTILGVQTIPANGEILLNTPFSVAIPQTFEGLVRIVMGEDVPFNISGTLHFDSNFGDISVPFSQSGSIPNADVFGYLDVLGVDVIESLFN